MKVCPYLLSQYVFTGSFCAIVMIILLVTGNTNGDSVNSDSFPWNATVHPGVFIHMTDIHISKINEDNNMVFNRALSMINSTFGKPLIALTGDIADNFDRKVIPKYGIPQQGEIDMYLEMLKTYDMDAIVAAGNHDAFSLYSFGSEQNYFRKLGEWTEDEYKVSVVGSKLIGGENFYFVVANPFQFPSPSPPLLFWVTPSKVFLDLLEDALDSITDPDAYIVLMGHYPRTVLPHGPKSKKGRTFETITGSGKISLSLVGHLHPSKAVMQHHSRVMEVTGADLVTHHKFAVVTVDNHRLAYHPINIDEPSRIFVTNPVDRTWLTSHQVFNEAGDARVIAFTQSEPEIMISVDGSEQQRLECVHNNSYFLCSGDMKVVASGVHTLVFSGDLERSVEFIIDNVSAPFSEKPVLSFNSERVAPLTATFWLILLIVVIPFNLPKSFEKGYMGWATDENWNGESYWLFSLFCGLCVMKMRINRLPWFYRILLLVSVLVPLAIPTIITSIEGHVAGVWTYGYFCGGKNVFDLWGVILTAMYLLGIVLPVMTLYSGLSNGLYKVLVLDVLFVLASAGFDIYVVLRWVAESAGCKMMLLSPGFVVMPLILYTSAIVLFATRKKIERHSPVKVGLLDDL